MSAEAGEILVHVLTFNHEQVIEPCISALAAATELLPELVVEVTDNCSTDGTPVKLSAFADHERFRLFFNENNLGFSGGQNQAVYRFLASDCSFLLLVNPDLRVLPPELKEFLEVAKAEFKAAPTLAAITGKVLQGNESLALTTPVRLDTTGMVFTPSLRHFDRGNGEIDGRQYDRPAEVPGISGAFMLLRREFILDVVVPHLGREKDVDRLHPSLGRDRHLRAQLFDEAFFAYREDAELCIRGRRLGWNFLYLPIAVGVHLRKVTPERRRKLSHLINRLGVRNRFLLQAVHFSLFNDFRCIIPGLLIRNLVVLLAVSFKERTSLVAFSDLAKLIPRSLERRSYFRKRMYAHKLSRQEILNHRSFCGDRPRIRRGAARTGSPADTGSSAREIVNQAG